MFERSFSRFSSVVTRPKFCFLSQHHPILSQPVLAISAILQTLLIKKINDDENLPMASFFVILQLVIVAVQLLT